ncbi:MAG TPA: hypothetical protein VMB50_24885, partial [Myxococcales bacterium]|nr:hypothetical protein [Myxococcales bacterium]
MTGPPGWLRSGWGRTAAVVVGCAFVGGIVWHLGPARVFGVLERSAPVFPVCCVLEGGMLVCAMLGLRSLYGPDRARLSAGSLAYAGLVGYVTMLIAPAGRAFAEVARAALLSRRSTTARAAHAAYQMQAACLLGNAVASVAAFAAALWLVGPKGYAWAIGANLALTGTFGVLMLTAGRRGSLGGLLGRLVPKAQDFGASFDEVARGGGVPWAAVLWESCGRLLQTLEFTLLV